MKLNQHHVLQKQKWFRRLIRYQKGIKNFLVIFVVEVNGSNIFCSQTMAGLWMIYNIDIKHKNNENLHF